ncbi:hypothetical protein V8C34DRAFT_173188 [Trichoderma compactum]
MGIMCHVLLLLDVSRLRNHYGKLRLLLLKRQLVMLFTYIVSLLRLVTYKDVLVIARTGVFCWLTMLFMGSVITNDPSSRVVRFERHLFVIQKQANIGD